MFVLFLAALLAGMASGESRIYRQNPVWAQEIPGKISTLKASGELILVGAENGVYLMDLGKSTRWSYPTTGQVTSARFLDRGRILVSSADGSMLMLHSNGSLIWERYIPGYVGSDDAIDTDGKSILCGSMDGFVYMMDYEGAYRWKHLVGSYVTNVRLLGDRAVAISDRQVYILDLDGKVRRNLDVSGYVRSAYVGGDRVIVGMSDGIVYAYNVNGSLAWSHKVGEYISAVDGSDNVTVGSREMHLFYLTRDGALLWSANMSAPVLSAEPSDGGILVSTADNKLHVYGTGGILKWYYDTDGRVSAMAADGENVLSGTTTGWVYYAKLSKKDPSTPLLVPAIVIIVAAAIVLMYRSWR
jgi:WD40 repeat protein